jgi:hypothetical protein
MSRFRSDKGRDPIVVETIEPPIELDVTVDAARMAQAVAIVDETLHGDRTDARRLTNALLEVRHALAPSVKPLEPPVPVIPGRS